MNERATEQLRRLRGHSVVFHTAVAVVRRATGHGQVDAAPVRVQFRQLSDSEIQHYLLAAVAARSLELVPPGSDLPS